MHGMLLFLSAHCMLACLVRFSVITCIGFKLANLLSNPCIVAYFVILMQTVLRMHRSLVVIS